MKISIDDRIIANFAIIPDVFMGKQLLRLLGWNVKETPLLYENLERMEEYGLLDRNSSRMYLKKYKSVSEWFEKEERRLIAEQKKKPKTTSNVDNLSSAEASSIIEG